MKVRLHENTLRVRITKSELESLAAGRRIEQKTEFSPESVLLSAVEASREAKTCSATFSAGRISVTVPLRQVQLLATSDEVGIEADQPVAAGRSLRILLEKDFQCLHGNAEENIDAFENPKASMDRAAGR
jgi:hypothetical protein